MASYTTSFGPQTSDQASASIAATLKSSTPGSPSPAPSTTALPGAAPAAPDPIASQLASKMQPKFPHTQFGTQAQTNAVTEGTNQRARQYQQAHMGLLDQVKSIFGWSPPPLTGEDIAGSQDYLPNPMIEQELEQKYAPEISQVEHLNNRIKEVNKLQAGQPGGPTGSGEGSAVTQTIQPIPEVPQVPIKDMAQRMKDEMVLSTMKKVVHAPTLMEKAAAVGNRVIRGASGGAIKDAFQEGTDPRLIEAQNYAHPKGEVQSLLEGAGELAGSLPYFMAAEGGAVRVGEALRSVEGIDNFYKTYPYLAHFVAKNVGMTVVDGAWKSATGQDYGAKEFLMNLGFQSTFDHVLGGSQARITAHVDNEVEALTKDLGRIPEPTELLDHLADKTVPGQNFTYGHLFAEQRFAYHSGIDPLNALPRKGIPGKDFPAPLPEPADGQMNAFGEDTPQPVMPASPNASMVDVNSVQTDPARFQFRDNVHPQLGYQEENVKGILDNQGFRPTEVRPLEIGRFPDASGAEQQYLVNGHNTLEILKRQGIPQAEARYIDFPNEAGATDYARRANMVSKAPEILQRVRIAGDLSTSGKSVEQIASELGRIKLSEAQNLLNIGKLDPSIQRQVSQGAIPPELAGVIGKYTNSLGLDVGMQEQLAKRVRDDNFTKTRLENYLDALGKAATATKQETTLFGLQDMPKGFDEIEQKLSEKKSEIASLQKQYKNAANLPEGELNKKQIAKFTKTQEELRQQVKAMDYLLATGGKGEQLVKPPKDLSRKVLADVQAELFGTTTENGIKLAGDEAIPKDLADRPRPAGPLSTEGQKVERTAYKYLGANKDKIFGKYDAPEVENPQTVFMAGGTGVGKTTVLRKGGVMSEPFVNIGSDNIKEDLFPVAKALGLPEEDLKSFMNKHSPAVHEPSSDASKEMFMANVGGKKNIVFDSNLTSTSAEERIDAAIKTGKPVSIVYVHRDPVDAYVNGVIPRMNRTGRLLPLEEHVTRHIDAPAKFLALYDKYNGKGVDFRVFDNSGAAGAIKESNIDLVRSLTYSADDVRNNIQQQLEETGSRGSDARGGTQDARGSSQSQAGQENGSVHGGEGGQGGGGEGPVAPPPPGAPIPVEELPALRPSKYSTVGAQQTLETVLRQHPDLLVSRTRGIISDAEALRKATELGVSKDTLLKLPEGSLLTKEQMVAARQMVAAHGEDVEKLKVAAELERQGEAGTEVQQEYVQALVEHAQLQSRIKGAAAEAGRSVQSFKMKLDPLDKQLTEFYDILHTADIKTADAMSRDFGNIDKNDVPAVKKLVNKYSDRDWRDMAVEFSTAAKLWAVKTLQVIETSHFLSNIAAAAFRAPVAGVDAIRSAVTGAPRERFLAEAAADFMGMRKGAWDAGKLWSNADLAGGAGYLQSIRKNAGTFWQALADESYFPLGESQDAISAPAIRGRGGSDAFIDHAMDAAGKVIRTPFRLHNAVYNAFRTMGDSGELGALAARQAFKEGLSGDAAWARVSEILSKPPSDLMELAQQGSKARNFQSDLGPAFSALNTLRNTENVGHVIKVFFDPFFKIPANIVKAGFSGVNPLLLWRGLRAGGGEASEALARFAIGSTTAAVLTWYAADHVITGSLPTDKKLADELTAHGWQPNSIRVGDKYYSWDRIEPYSQYFRIAASLAQAYRATGKLDQGMVTQFSVELMKQTVNRSFFKGISDTLNAMASPERYGQNWVNSFLYANTPGSGLAAGITSAIDTDSNGRTIVRNPKNFTEFLKSKIPGLSPGVAPKFDSQGRPVTKPGGLINSMLSPTSESDATASKADMAKMESDFKDFKNFRSQQTSRAANLKLQARQTIMAWGKLPPDARVQNAAQLQRANPELFAKVKAVLQSKAKGFTFQDQDLQDLSPTERAQYMVSILRKMTPDARVQQGADWQKKGLLTTATMAELRNALHGTPAQ